MEKQPGKFVGDTRCEKLPVEICGNGCTSREGPEECHDKKITSLVDVPEEVCDLNPQKTCRLQTKLVPSLKPEHECTIVPQEICNLRFTTPELKEKPLVTKWCLEDGPTVPRRPAETYEEANARGAPLRRQGRSFEGGLTPPRRNSKRGNRNKNKKKMMSMKDDDKMPFKTQQFEEFTDVSNADAY